MEYNNVNKLIEKYWAGETDLQEESTLKSYFSSADVHPSLVQYQPLFSYFHEAKKDKSLDNIDTAVLDHIRHKAVPTKPKVISISRLLKIAAAALILIGATFTFYNYQVEGEQSRITIYDDNPTESVEAYLELKAALALVSNKIDDGKQQAIKGLVKTKTISIMK